MPIRKQIGCSSCNRHSSSSSNNSNNKHSDLLMLKLLVAFLRPLHTWLQLWLSLLPIMLHLPVPRILQVCMHAHACDLPVSAYD